MELTEIGNKVIESIKDEWILKGHNLTDSFINSLEIRETPSGIEIWGNTYSKYVNRGVPAANIPYQRGSGAGKSKYITGLHNYVILRMGLSEKEALGVAFAIAETHKKNGMLGSGFLDEAIKMNDIDIDKSVKDYIDKHIIKWHLL
jgi:hypothetical protein